MIVNKITTLLKKSFFQRRVDSGFTLIELLVVITIITILTLVSLYAFLSVQKQGRDAKRQSDLRVIQSALEQYHSDQLFYPNSSGSNNWSASVPLTNSIGNPVTPASAVTYLKDPPSDPAYTSGYIYDSSPAGCDNSTTKCVSYCLYAYLETLGTNTSFATGCNSSVPISGAPGNANYSISTP